MVSFIRQILSPPVFEDEETNYQAYLLHVIVWGLILLPLPYLAYVLITSPQYTTRALIQSGIGEALNFLIMYLMRTGRVQAASHVQIISLWIFFAISATTGNGVKGEAYLLGFPLVIIMAGILLGGRAALAVTLAALTAGGIMLYGESSGLFQSRNESTPPITWIISLAFFPTSMLLQYLSTRTVRSALARAKASEERYRLISKVSTNYSFETRIDEQGHNRLTWVGGGFTEMTGYTYEEYLATGGWLAHVHPDDLGKDARDIQRLHNNQDVISEIRTFTKSGEIRWERIYAHPIWDRKKNQLAGIIGAVRDVTEEKLADAILKESLAKQAAILDNIPDSAWLKDRDGKYVAVNEAFVRLTGMARDELIGKTDREIWPAHIAEKYRRDDLDVIENRQAVSFDELQPDDEGNEFWVQTSKSPIMNDQGEVIGTTGIARDITQHKLSEQYEQNRRAMLEKIVNLGQYVTEVQDVHTTLQRIWHVVHHELNFDRLGIYLYDAQNNMMHGTYGTNNDGEIVEEWHYHISLNDETIETISFINALQNKNGVYITRDYETEHNVPTGHIMDGVKDYAAVAAWAGEKPVAVLCVDHAVTQRPITDEQLESLRLFAGYSGLAIENARLNEALQLELAQRKNFIEELEAKNMELERFTYTVSHDLKSPLVTITGFLGYLEKDALAGNMEKFKQDMERIATAVNKMQRLLKDLLELSRIGRLMNPPADIKFEDIVHDALELVQGQIKEKNVAVEFDNQNITIRGDHLRLVEVVQNLVDNAIKFSESRPNPQVQIGSLTTEANETTFFVKDNGIGIAPDYHEKIFGLFNKLNPEGGGTGVGLTLVKRIIEVHGGRIWVESAPGEGATFYFTLPTVA